MKILFILNLPTEENERINAECLRLANRFNSYGWPVINISNTDIIEKQVPSIDYFGSNDGIFLCGLVDDIETVELLQEVISLKVSCIEDAFSLGGDIEEGELSSDISFVKSNELVCNPDFIEENDYSCFEDVGITQGELASIEYLDINLKPGQSILHIGVGTSSIAERYSGITSFIDGVTIAGKEKDLADSLNLENYNCYMANKYNYINMMEYISGQKYDYIIDVNLKSYTCCELHYKLYFNTLFSLLKKPGKILTAADGMSWGSTVARNNETAERTAYYTNYNGFNVLTREQLLLDSNSLDGIGREHKLQSETLFELAF